MKKIILLLLAFVPLFASFAESKAIVPFVAPAFGKVITIEAMFVEKPNTCWAQKMVKEPYFIKVISVDGKKLKKAFTMEYSIGNSMKKKLEPQKDKKYKLLAYETIFSFGEPLEWNKWLAQFNYHIYHKLIVKPKE